MTNGVSLKKFNGNIVTLNIQIPQPLEYTVTDTAGNTRKEIIDVAQFVPQE